MITPLKIDSKGRISIPKRYRELIGLQPGDAMFLDVDEETGTLQIKKALNPFDELAREARKELDTGEARDLDDIMAELGVELENDERE